MSSVAHVIIVVCISFYLNMVDKTQQSSTSLIWGGISFTTMPQFWFHCEILTINLTAFVKDFVTFQKRKNE